jgi:hypothetical protein
MLKRLILLFWLLAVPLTAAPQGHFLVGEQDGEEFVFSLDFEGDSVVVKTLEGEPWTHQTSLERTGEDLYRFVIDFPDGKQEVTLIHTGEDELVLSSADETSVLRGFRVETFPSWLNGRWNLEDGESGLSFEDDTATLYQQDEEVMGKVFPLSSRGPVARVILMEAGANSVLLHLVRLDDNTLLVWDHDDGNTKRFTRQGWMTK